LVQAIPLDDLFSYPKHISKCASSSSSHVHWDRGLMGLQRGFGEKGFKIAGALHDLNDFQAHMRSEFAVAVLLLDRFRKIRLRDLVVKSEYSMM
jgi:hypothetical protein